MDTSTHITLTDLADERQVSVQAIRQLCAVARIPIPTSEKLSPSAWKKLDRYIYTQYKLAAGQPLPR